MSAPKKLTPTMRRHLLELLETPYWQPATPGEWACARALCRRRLLDFNPSAGYQSYSLNDAGRAAAAIESGRRA